MSKNIKDFLHLYLGCESQRSINGRHHENLIIDERVLADTNSDTPVYNYKPILRPLSDMDYETEIIVGKILDPSLKDQDDYNGYSYTHNDVATWFVKHFDDGDSETSWNPYQIIKVVNELRCRGFDCDKLIESGIALDKSKHQTP